MAEYEEFMTKQCAVEGEARFRLLGRDLMPYEVKLLRLRAALLPEERMTASERKAIQRFVLTRERKRSPVLEKT